MALKFHEPGFAYAQRLITEGEVLHDSLEKWQESAPDRDDKVRFLNTHSIHEYGQWFLAIDEDKPENSIERYAYPHGDFNEVHKSALLTIEQENPSPEITRAAQQLLSLIKK